MKIIIYKFIILYIELRAWYITPEIFVDDSLCPYDRIDEIEIDQKDAEAKGFYWNYDFGNLINRPRYVAEIVKVYWLCFRFEFKRYAKTEWGKAFPKGFSSYQNNIKAYEETGI